MCRLHTNAINNAVVEAYDYWTMPIVEFYLYPTVGTVLIHSVKPELTE